MHLEADGAARDRQLADLKTNFLAAQTDESSDGGPGHGLSPLIGYGPLLEVRPERSPMHGPLDETISDWLAIVGELRKIGNLRTQPFLHVSALRSSGRVYRRIDLAKDQLLIPNGRITRLQVVSEHGAATAVAPGDVNPSRTAKSVKINAKADPQRYRLNREDLVLAGGYDVGWIEISPRHAGAQTSLVITPVSAAIASDQYDPSIVIELVSPPTLLMRTLSIVALVIFVLLYASTLIPPLAAIYLPKAFERPLQDVSVIGAAVAITLLILDLSQSRDKGE
jgi:hypothetical protein